MALAEGAVAVVALEVVGKTMLNDVNAETPSTAKALIVPIAVGGLVAE